MTAFRRRFPVRVAAFVLASLVVACGGSPMAPNPTPQPPANNNPVIVSIRIQGSKPNEPANFADVGETISVSAEVRDDETAVSHLQFAWSAGVGTFSGNGPAVTWQAPAAAASAANVALRLEVVERYGPASAPTAFEHRVSGSADVRLHDSAREVGDMARQFLLDFSDSSIRDVDYIMRNFEPGCYGTADERQQVQENRADFRIIESAVGSATTSVGFGGVCSFRSRPGDACARVPVMWDSVKLSNGVRGVVRSIDQVAAVYVRSRGDWRLCDSQFDGSVPLHMRGFIR